MISNNPNFGIPTGFKCITVKVSNNVITGYTSNDTITPIIVTNLSSGNTLLFNFNKNCYWFFGLNTFITNNTLSINYSPIIVNSNDHNTIYQPDECNPTLLHIIQKGYGVGYMLPTTGDFILYLYYFEQ